MFILIFDLTCAFFFEVADSPVLTAEISIVSDHEGLLDATRTCSLEMQLPTTSSKCKI